MAMAGYAVASATIDAMANANRPRKARFRSSGDGIPALRAVSLFIT
jgi:hypothetical protein